MPSKKSPKILTRSQILARVKKQLLDWGGFLGLLNVWDIHLEFANRQDSNRDNGAYVQWSPGSKTARIYLVEDEFNQASYQISEALILHELLHLFYAPVSGAIARLVGKESAVGAALDFEEETILDSLTNLLMRTRYGDDYGLVIAP